MKILIAYSSKTGNTKKLADYVSGLNSSCTLRPIDGAHYDLDIYDLIIVGGWIDQGSFDKNALAFSQNLKHKKVAFFFTLSAYATSKHAYDCAHNINQVLLKNNNEVLDFFWTQAPLDPALKKRMYQFDESHPHYPDANRIKKWEIAENHPNDEDYEVAKNFMSQCLRKLNHAN